MKQLPQQFSGVTCSGPRADPSLAEDPVCIPSLQGGMGTGGPHLWLITGAQHPKAASKCCMSSLVSEICRRWGPSAGSPWPADLEPAESLICWRVLRCSLCKLVAGVTSAAPDFLPGVLGGCLQNSSAAFPALFLTFHASPTLVAACPLAS